MSGTKQKHDRLPSDFYVTPKMYVASIIPMLDRLTSFDGRRGGGIALDPFAGTGRFRTVLDQYFDKWIEWDLYPQAERIQKVDFLKPDLYPTGVISEIESNLTIISNPPYSILDEVLVQSLELYPNRIAYFVRLSALEGKRRYENIWSNLKKYDLGYKDIGINVMVRRPSFGSQYGGATDKWAYCWLLIGQWSSEDVPGINWTYI